MIGEIIYMDCRRTRAAEKHVREGVANNVCLCGCGAKPKKLGLADPCYKKFETKCKGMPRLIRAKFIAKARERGWVLAPYEICELKKTSVFDELASEFN